MCYTINKSKRGDDFMSELYDYYKESYNELLAMLDVICDQVTIADGKGMFIRISKSCEKNFGVSRSNIIGSTCYELERKGIFSSSSTSAVLKEKKEVTLIQTTKSGRKLMVTGKPLFDEDGNIYRVINVSSDITKEESLENRLMKTEEALNMIKKEILEDNKRVNQNTIVGNSNLIHRTLKTLNAVSALNVTVLLSGETGVGKSLYARYLHNISPKRSEPFIQINCGAMPADLIESELFGYSSGAFTGANKNGKVGLLEASQKGTLFLDEISAMPYNLQVKLLHVLQEKSYFRLGETKERKFEARVIAASNENLEKLVSEGLFREDLFYRLNVVPIEIPSLRKRKEDIPLLATHFIKITNQKYNFNKKLTKNALIRLQDYNWPGNVRQLENSIERILVITQKDIIDEFDLDDVLFNSEPNREIIKTKNLKESLENFERNILKDLIDSGKSTREIATILEINQSTVVRKIKKHNLI